MRQFMLIRQSALHFALKMESSVKESVIRKPVMRGLLLAVSFLTAIPVHRLYPKLHDQASTRAEFRWALIWFPGVGGLLGAALYGLAVLLSDVLFVNSHVTALILVVAMVLATRGLHVDGVADAVDGLSADHRKALEVMRDSRVGAHGATAIALLLLSTWVVFQSLVDAGHYIGLLVGPIVARSAAVICIFAFPYARDAGLGADFKAAADSPVAWSAIAWVALCVASILIWSGTGLLGGGLAICGALLLAWGTMGLIAHWISKRLSGLTGDVYGLLIEGSQIVFWLSLSTRLGT